MADIALTITDANADRDSLHPRFFVNAITAHLAELFPADAVQEDIAEGAPDPALHPLPIDRAPKEVVKHMATTVERHNWMTEVGRQQRDETHGAYRRLVDMWVSTTDPDATLMRKKGGGSHLGYHTQYVVDGGKARIILGALVTPSEVMEHQPMLDLLWRARFRWHLPLEQVTGDTTYGTVENIVAIEEAGLHAYVPLPDFDRRTPLLWEARLHLCC